MEKYFYLVILFPLIGFLVNGLLGSKMKGTTPGLIGTVAVFIPFLIALGVFFNYGHESQPILQNYFPWINIFDFQANFSILIDPLSLQMTLIITGIGSLIHLYSIGYMHDDEGFARFFSYLNLFIFSMLLLVLGSNLLILFIGWEGVGLCSYLLIGFWYKNEDYGYAARKAFVMNRIGDLGLIAGIVLLWSYFKTIEFQAMAIHAANVDMSDPVIIIATLCLFIGAIGKSAQIPLYTWLPDAMAGPTPVSALIHAATMVTAGIYLLVRAHFLFDLAPSVLNLVSYVGIATSIFAAIIALRQNDIKKVLAYSTVSQLGLMFVALGVGAYTTAMFHVTTHAFFKALLFLGAGSVIHALHGEQDIRNMGGLKNEIKSTYWVFLIGTLAICGIFPLSGMFSKDEILAVLFEKNKGLWALSLFSSLLTAVYMFRLLFLTFFGTYRGDDHTKSKIHESPMVMMAPLWVLAILSVFGGILNLPHLIGGESYGKMAHFLDPIFSHSKLATEHMDAGLEIGLMALVVGLVVIIGFVLYNIYVKKESLPKPDMSLRGVEALVANKFGVDELYDTVISKPVLGISRFFGQKVESAFDGISGFFFVAGFKSIGNSLRKIQNGNVEFYLILMTGSIVVLMILQFLIKI